MQRIYALIALAIVALIGLVACTPAAPAGQSLAVDIGDQTDDVPEEARDTAQPGKALFVASYADW